MNTFSTSMGMGYGWLMPLIPLAIIAMLFYLFRNKEPHAPTAQEILNQRYANGGIDKEEYDAKSAHIQQYS